MILSPVFVLLFAGGCGGSPSEPGNAIHFDPCLALTLVPDDGLSDRQMAGLRAGIALWNGSAHTRLSVGNAAASPPALPIHFQAAAAPFHGFYDDRLGRVFINDDLVDQPQAIVIAHEIGHAFALGHVNQRPSVMNSGNLDTEPTSEDVDALASVWGRCAPGVDIPSAE